MNCPEFERWLDLGMPEGWRADALRHADACEGCAESLAAAGAVEAMLREEPAGAAPAEAPRGFSELVLARIEGSERGAHVHAVPQREPWWIAWALDPASAVAITAAVVLTAIARWHPAWLLDPGLAWMTRMSEWTGAASREATTFGHAAAPVWLAIGIGLAPIAIWGAAMFVRRIERLVLLLVAR